MIVTTTATMSSGATTSGEPTRRDFLYVATGSVITDSVPADALAIGRGRQVVKENRDRTAEKLRVAQEALMALEESLAPPVAWPDAAHLAELVKTMASMPPNTAARVWIVTREILFSGC